MPLDCPAELVETLGRAHQKTALDLLAVRTTPQKNGPGKQQQPGAVPFPGRRITSGGDPRGARATPLPLAGNDAAAGGSRSLHRGGAQQAAAVRSTRSRAPSKVAGACPCSRRGVAGGSTPRARLRRGEFPARCPARCGHAARAAPRGRAARRSQPGVGVAPPLVGRERPRRDSGQPAPPRGAGSPLSGDLRPEPDPDSGSRVEGYFASASLRSRPAARRSGLPPLPSSGA